MTEPARRLLGLTFDDKPIWEPNPAASGLVYAAMGGGKTTCAAMPTIMSLLSDEGQALLINDVKAEIAPQIAAMCLKHGRRFGVVDPFRALGAGYEHRITVNASSAAQSAARDECDDLPFVIEAMNHALIEEPANDQRNFYWRESPREILAVAQGILLRRTPRLATPGGLASLLSDPATFTTALVCEADDEDSPLRNAAAQIIELRESNKEHYSQHLRAALSALKIFAAPPLRDDGRFADLTHEELIRDKWVVCFVNPLRHADRLGPYYAQHFVSLMQAQLSGRFGRACWVLDEFCNAPLRDAVIRITGYRAFGLKCLFITQSRQDAIRRYGQRETAVLEENCGVTQWLRFSNFEEAERVSRAMGEALHVSRSLGLNSDRFGFSGTLGTGKQRLFTPYELMSLPAQEQIIHVADVGFIHAKKIRQNEIAPYCFDLADNPLEGGRLTPDPKVFLKTTGGTR